MGVYIGSVISITPLTTDDNCALDPAATESGKVIEVFWGGESTASTAMATKVSRGSGGTTPVAGDVQKRNENSVANKIEFIKGPIGWAAEPALDAGSLFALSWNCHGGVVRWLAAPGEEWMMLGAAAAADTISIRNSVGTGVSTYGMIWDED